MAVTVSAMFIPVHDPDAALGFYRSQVEGDALLSLVTQGSLQAAIFRSDDLDATFEKVRASDAEVLQDPASQPWGARDCAFHDPAGNLVRIAQA
ncbi:MAG: VOC family protein [Nocardioidaceae bacterium]|jgi:predicted enzyme related to lactoylglutathione lyase